VTTPLLAQHIRSAGRRLTPGFFTRLTIAQQLRLGFALGGVALLIVGLGSAVLLRVLTGTLDQTVREVSANERTIGAMRDALSTENAGVQGYLIAGDEAQLQRFDQGHQQFVAAAHQLANQPADEDPETAQQYVSAANDVITLEAQFYTLGQQEVSLSKEGFQDTAAFEWQREGESAQNALRTRLDDLTSNRLQYVQSRLDQAHSYEFWTRLAFAPIIAVLAGMGLLVAFMVSDRMTRRFGALEADVARIEAGSFKLPPAAPGNDELDRLARSLRQMAAALDADTREREALLTERARANARISALYDVAVTLNQSLDPDEVLRLALDKLVAYTGMNSGSAYLIDEHSGRFRLNVAIHVDDELFAEMQGYTEDDDLQKLLARIAARPTLTQLQLHRIPHYHGPYRSSICVPLRWKGRELGILALSSLDDIALSSDAVQLIEGLATQVGTALEHARLTARSRQLAVSDERNRIARDLHDSVTQTLFSISMIAQALPSLIERQPEKAGERAGRLGELSRGALAEMRMLILELRPQALQEMGLVEALRRHAEGWSSREGISAEVRADGLQRRLPQSHEEALFRVAQEALTNVAKHAQAQKATLVVDFEPQTVSLLVEDDGVGLPAAVDGGGLGMTTMRERVEGLHGNFSASRRAEGGTLVTACLPSPPPTTSITP
jgi:nitrate/nitrite-specific signal transduction histidine kinase